MRQFLFVLVTLMAFSCGKMKDPEAAADSPPDPEHLLLELTHDRRFVSVDKVADWIISDDPALVLVDVRSHEEYDAFTLPGAVNVPLESFLDEDQQTQLDCSRYSLVFFSNGTLKSEQAWILGRRLGCRDMYVMQGGLNDWASKILQPQEPAESASAEAFEVYQFRKAALQYFIGGSEAMDPEPYVQQVVAPPPAPKKEVVPKKKKKVVEEEEGC